MHSRDVPETAQELCVRAEHGDAEAQTALGTMYRYGRSVPQDDVEAVRWYRLAAEQGHATAQWCLGAMYADGRGVPQDDVAAVRCYRLAAEQGHADMQWCLGFIYAYGRGVPQDDVEAVRWYRLAAVQGYAYAQQSLGLMCEDGRGVPQDHPEAVRWYRLAAEQGDAYAQYRLGSMYEDGRGMPQDYLHAHKWFNLAASGSMDRAMQGRDRVASRMTSSLLAEAQRLAREWRPTESPSHTAKSPDSAGRAPGIWQPPAARSIERVATGSGFFISSQGHILTNAHVVRECAAVRIPPGIPVRVVARDDSSDLALLEGPSARNGAVAVFRQGRGIRPGADIVVIGYPLRGFVASEPNVTTGNVSALAGPGDDRRLFQMTAPIQPGSSGGPVLDAAGRVVGVTVSKIDAMRIIRDTGAIPQNVNFAVSAGTVRAFLDAEGVPYETAPSDELLESEVVAASARGFTVLIECWT